MILTTAFVLGILLYVGIILIFLKFPEFVKEFLIRHALFTDLSATIGSFILLGSISNSLIAAIASALVGVLFSLSLNHLGTKREEDAES